MAGRVNSRMFSTCILATWVVPVAAQAQAPTTIHDFHYSAGSSPSGSLISVGGVLFGTTEQGGAYGQGIVYSMSTAGVEEVLYNFGNRPNDGLDPNSGLTSLGGNLYGTTPRAGTLGYGTVFMISGTQETVLHNFAAGQDGANAFGSLLAIDGALYGTTLSGGAANAGTLFKIGANAQESVLYAFGVTSGDGTRPNGSLVNINNTFYGTTQAGGEFNAGTVFSITSTGVEKALYSFTGGKDGLTPNAGLAVISPTALYGTTSKGGQQNAGVVFEITPAGAETTIYAFKGATAGPSDGADPNGPLVVLNGSLYGTTLVGGTSYGTIFQLKPQVGEIVLYSFAPAPSEFAPAYPQPLTVVDGLLYGTTNGGGTGLQGTVFSLAP